jgi:hypothetical protein
VERLKDVRGSGERTGGRERVEIDPYSFVAFRLGVETPAFESFVRRQAFDDADDDGRAGKRAQMTWPQGRKALCGERERDPGRIEVLPSERGGRQVADFAYPDSLRGDEDLSLLEEHVLHNERTIVTVRQDALTENERHLGLVRPFGLQKRERNRTLQPEPTLASIAWMGEDAERRRYRRLKVPVFCRAAGVGFMTQRHPIDMSLGGVRIYSDQSFAKGERLTLEVMTVDAPLTTFIAEVVWIEELPAGSPAKFDVGLRFRAVDPNQAQFLEALLNNSE